MKFHFIIFFEIQFLMIKLLRRNREDKTEKGNTVREKRSQLVISWPRVGAHNVLPILPLHFKKISLDCKVQYKIECNHYWRIFHLYELIRNC